MKAIIGVDARSEYEPVVQLYRNAAFRDAKTTLVHASSSVMPFIPMDFYAVAEAQAQFARDAEVQGEQALDEARRAHFANDPNCTTKLRPGAPAAALIAEAEETGADLIAVNATHTGRWTNSFLGSVSKSITVGSKSSVLISKGGRSESKKLKVVLATDHSDYSEQWIGHFLNMKPEGISAIHVVTAFDVDPWQAQVVETNMPEYMGDLLPFLRKKLRERDEALVDRLQQAGYKTESQIVDGFANNVIRQAMQSTGADLLVMGAQGHGFLERVLIGSIALHQVMAEPYPVMVVRPAIA